MRSPSCRLLCMSRVARLQACASLGRTSQLSSTTILLTRTRIHNASTLPATFERDPDPQQARADQTLELPHHTERGKPSVWLSYLERYLPRGGHDDQEVPFEAQALVVRALKINVNLVTYLQLERGDSDTAQRILSHLGRQMAHVQDLQTSIHSHFVPIKNTGQSRSLDEWTANVHDAQEASSHSSHFQAYALALGQQWQSPTSLTRALYSGPFGSSHSSPACKEAAEAFWRIMGHFAIHTADMAGRTAREPLVSLIWTNLSWIAYDQPLLDKVVASYEMLAAHGDERAPLALSWLKAIPDQATSPPHFDVDPALLLELILWLSIHGKWHQAAANTLVVGGLLSRKGTSWGIGMPGVNVSGVKHKLSPMVMRTLVEALKNDLSHPDFGSSNKSMRTIEDAINNLTNIKSEPHWLTQMSADAINGLVSDLPHAQPIISSPRLRQYIGMPSFLHDLSSSQNLSGNGPEYVHDPSAISLALYHRLLADEISHRDVQGAVKTLGKLQNYTDNFKQKSVLDFFDDIRSLNKSLERSSREVVQDVDLVSHFRGMTPTNTYVALPKPLLASLLDLFTDSNELELAHWMIYSGNNAEGPLIDPAHYRDPNVAAALMRYASVAQDIPLLKRILRKESFEASGRTLVALCATRLQSGQFRHALRVFDIIQQYNIARWTLGDIATLVSALLMHLGDGTETHHRGTAVAMVFKLLRGDLGIGPEPAYTYQRPSIAKVVAGIDKEVARACENIWPEGMPTTIDMPTDVFNTLLVGVCKSFGSAKAASVYQQWCLTSQLQSGSEGRISEQFGYTGPQANEETRALFTSGAPIKAEMSTMRIIINQALQEYRQDDALNTESDYHQVLAWTERLLALDFNLSDADIDYEMQGYLSTVLRAESPAKPPKLYNARIFTLWRAVTRTEGTERPAALENQLRAFAQDDTTNAMRLERIPAIESALVRNLCQEYGLSSELILLGEARDEKMDATPSSTVVIRKRLGPNKKPLPWIITVPSTSVQEAADRWFAGVDTEDDDIDIAGD